VTPSDDIQVRPASPGEARRAADIVARHGGTPGGADPGDSLLYSSLQNAAVAAQGDDLLGLCVYVPSEGRCTAVLVPRLVEWDEALAARLIRVTSALARKRHDARLIQTLLAPDLPRPITAAYERAGFEPLAELAYMRRAMRPEDGRAATVADLEWRGYSFFRRGEFARAIAASYIDSLDCPRLAGLRTVGDALATHKATGIFSPKTWHVARQGGEPVGVELINNLSGRSRTRPPSDSLRWVWRSTSPTRPPCGCTSTRGSRRSAGASRGSCRKSGSKRSAFRRRDAAAGVGPVGVRG
jgi:hypothetical protein